MSLMAPQINGDGNKEHIEIDYFSFYFTEDDTDFENEYEKTLPGAYCDRIVVSKCFKYYEWFLIENDFISTKDINAYAEWFDRLVQLWINNMYKYRSHEYLNFVKIEDEVNDSIATDLLDYHRKNQEFIVSNLTILYYQIISKLEEKNITFEPSSSCIFSDYLLLVRILTSKTGLLYNNEIEVIYEIENNQFWNVYFTALQNNQQNQRFDISYAIIFFYKRISKMERLKIIHKIIGIFDYHLKINNYQCNEYTKSLSKLLDIFYYIYIKNLNMDDFKFDDINDYTANLSIVFKRIFENHPTLTENDEIIDNNDDIKQINIRLNIIVNKICQQYDENFKNLSTIKRVTDKKRKVKWSNIVKSNDEANNNNNNDTYVHTQQATKIKLFDSSHTIHIIKSLFKILYIFKDTTNFKFAVDADISWNSISCLSFYNILNDKKNIKSTSDIILLCKYISKATTIMEAQVQSNLILLHKICFKNVKQEENNTSLWYIPMLWLHDLIDTMLDILAQNVKKFEIDHHDYFKVLFDIVSITMNKYYQSLSKIVTYMRYIIIEHYQTVTLNHFYKDQQEEHKYFCSIFKKCQNDEILLKNEHFESTNTLYFKPVWYNFLLLLPSNFHVFEDDLFEDPKYNSIRNIQLFKEEIKDTLDGMPLYRSFVLGMIADMLYINIHEHNGILKKRYHRHINLIKLILQYKLSNENKIKYQNQMNYNIIMNDIKYTDFSFAYNPNQDFKQSNIRDFMCALLIMRDAFDNSIFSPSITEQEKSKLSNIHHIANIAAQFISTIDLNHTDLSKYILLLNIKYPHISILANILNNSYNDKEAITKSSSNK